MIRYSVKAAFARFSSLPGIRKNRSWNVNIGSSSLEMVSIMNIQNEINRVSISFGNCRYLSLLDFAFVSFNGNTQR